MEAAPSSCTILRKRLFCPASTPFSMDPIPMPTLSLTPANTLPADAARAALAGRVWRPDLGGPSVVVLRGDDLVDSSSAFATMRDLCGGTNPAAALAAAKGERVGSLAEILANTPAEGRDASKPWLLAPVDLQAVKAAGVTFAISMLERVIEEKARGNPAAAAAIRGEIGKAVGLLMAAHRVTADEAFAILRKTSQDLNIKLASVAELVVQGRDDQAKPRSGMPSSSPPSA